MSESDVRFNVLGFSCFVDSNFVGDKSTANEELRTLHCDGMIALVRTDTVATELADAKDSERQGELYAESRHYDELFGPLVLNHSRLGSAVLGNDDDEARLDSVYRILFPGSDRHDETTGRARRKTRDAMHVATAIRYGGPRFLTRDNDILSKAKAIEEAFPALAVMSPEEALAVARRLEQRHQVRRAAVSATSRLPPHAPGSSTT